MAYIVHMSVLAHITARCSISLWCLPSSFSVLRWKNSRMCGCFLAPLSGITLTTPTIHSQHCILSNSYELVASSPPSVQMSASTRVSHGAAPSSSVSRPQVTHSAISPQVQTSRTRTVTSDLMSATLAEAATQLSFAEFLERCISLSAPPPPPLPIPIPLLDAATQTIPHIAVSQDVSTQLLLEEFSLRCVHPHNPSGALAPPSTHDVLCSTCSRPVPSLLLDAALQTPLHSVAAHDASTQPPLTEFFNGRIFSNDPLDR